MQEPNYWCHNLPLFLLLVFLLNVLILNKTSCYSKEWKEDELSIKWNDSINRFVGRRFCKIFDNWDLNKLKKKNFCNEGNRFTDRYKNKNNASFIRSFHKKHHEGNKTHGSLPKVCYLTNKNEEIAIPHNIDKEKFLYFNKEDQQSKKNNNFNNKREHIEQIEQLEKLKNLENEDENKNRNAAPPLDIYIDKINKMIDVESYKEIYGENIYNTIKQLYVQRNIPQDYEETYFHEKIDKSIAFQIKDYDDSEFEKLMEREFQKNGLFIEVIDKKYYSKNNIMRIQKILNYLPLLKLINNPNDLKKLKKEYLPLLIHELKIFIHFVVNITGGHFSSTLGLAELQVLLLYIFNQPFDYVMYDVGHQVYIHKLLTGRKYLFLSLRMKKGISGFFAGTESIYDTFITGHSSTSLSVMQGFYEADRQVYHWKFQNKKYSENSRNANEQQNPEKFYIAVIGDGGMTGGIALEALNYISFLNSKILIIYNDNREISLPTNTMSVSGNRPIGSIADHTYDILKKKMKETMQEEEVLTKQPKEHTEKNFFENLNYEYIGPINGSNINELHEVLVKIQKDKIQKPTVLHIVTNKSSKYIDQVSSVAHWHNIYANELFPFDDSLLDDVEEKKGFKTNEKQAKIEEKSPFEKKTMTDIYTAEMLKYLDKDRSIIMISPATAGGTGLVKMSEKFSNNIYDVGIAEQHAVAFSTAMAKNKKLKVFLNIYSTFLQRGYDQVIHDLNLQNIPLKIIIARSGLVGKDGATHQGIYDLTVMGALNNSHIISPSNQVDFKKALEFVYHDKNRIVFLRIPKGNIYQEWYLKEYMNIRMEEEEKRGIENFFGKARVIQMEINTTKCENGYQRNLVKKEKKKVAILNMGYMLHNVISAVKELEQDKMISDMYSFSIIDMIFLNPFDKNIVDFLIKEDRHQYFITYEDNTFGGFATHFNNYLIENNYITKYNLFLHNMYLPNEPIEHNSEVSQCEFSKMDKLSIIKRIKKLLHDSLS